MKRVAELLLSCGRQGSHLPATLLYNEGWLLRLILDCFSRQSEFDHPLAFSIGADWYTEGLLPTQFKARLRGDSLAEGRTHSDGVIGHFAIGHEGKGDLTLRREATQFVVVEAKLFSALSAGTRRATKYDQAARNVACMAHVVAETRVPLDQFQRLGFVVLAPAEQIERNLCGRLVTREGILAKILHRASGYAGTKDAWCRDAVEPLLDTLKLSALSWEDLLSTIAVADPVSGEAMKAFYSNCLEHTRPEWNRSGTQAAH